MPRSGFVLRSRLFEEAEDLVPLAHDTRAAIAVSFFRNPCLPVVLYDHPPGFVHEPPLECEHEQILVRLEIVGRIKVDDVCLESFPSIRRAANTSCLII